jgi:hypothetical protein
MSPVESWHRKIKAGIKEEMHRNYSILGALFQVIECSDDWLISAESAAFKFRRYSLPHCSNFPGFQLEKFPNSVQVLLLDQVKQARKWVEEGEPVYERMVIPGWRDEETAEPPLSDSQLENHLETYRNSMLNSSSNISLEQSTNTEAAPANQGILAGPPRCECQWFQAWQLPCAHIWHHHLRFASLVPAHFAQLVDKWTNKGYDIYEETRQPS